MPAPKQRRDRFSIDIEPGLRRRIEVAAASRGLSVREYVEGILTQAVAGLAAKVDPAERGLARIEVPPMTAEEQERGLRALEQIRVLSAELFEKHGPFVPDSVELIREAREERTRHLMRLSGLDKE